MPKIDPSESSELDPTGYGAGPAYGDLSGKAAAFLFDWKEMGAPSHSWAEMAVAGNSWAEINYPSHSWKEMRAL